MVKICNSPYISSEYNSYFDTFSYPLSDFQKYAIEGIVQGNHVLVTAPTGSGKTLPAIFAIDHFTKIGKKVVYTSPIKALSNQKYWEFTSRFTELSIGLCTGDIKTNPCADVIVMTTEILMNYLFRGSNSQNKFLEGTDSPEKTESTDFQLNIEDLGCVIFDEVHYINDRDRGHVWEQTIISLPSSVQMVMLSATIDHPEHFANWVESTNNKQVWLCPHSVRSVPLTHYSYLTIGQGIYKAIKDPVLKQEIRQMTNKLICIKNSANVVQESNIQSVKKMLSLFEDKGQWTKRKFVINSIVQRLYEGFVQDVEKDYEPTNTMLPAIIFVFSRKQVEQIANEIESNVLPNDSKIPAIVAKECEQILRSRLTNAHEYLNNPDYIALVKLLEKGVAIHHSGMIPILREIVELLISKKYVYLLVATESFAIGLDCPIKTAIFVSMSKYDGSAVEGRLLHAHEYSQMSGRAGRRGIDTIGNVIHCNNLFPCPSITEYREIIGGKPPQLTSKFHISYSMILSLLQHNDGTITYDDIELFIRHTMMFQENRTLEEGVLREINILEEKINRTVTYLVPLEDLLSFHRLKQSLEYATNKKRKEIQHKLNLLQDSSKHFTQSYQMFLQGESVKQDLAMRKKELDDIRNQVKQTIYNVLTSMCKESMTVGSFGSEGTFVQPCSWTWTETGKMASHFAEIHPLIFSKLLVTTNYFEKLTEQQIVGILSCFTNIRKHNDTDNVTGNNDITDETMNTIINSMEECCCQMPFNEKQDFTRDAIHSMMNWTQCEDETSCKILLSGCPISTGDFCKGILKIVSILGEIEKALPERIDVLHKCSLIRPMLLKYIATSQSLYV